MELILMLGLGLAGAAPAAAERPLRPTLEQIERTIVDRNPKTRVDRVDSERIAVRRLDIVDEKGVIRLTLAAPAPEPILDGIQYRRAFDVSGITIYDENGSERGGFGYAEVPGGATVIALDHANSDAVGFRVMPDGSVMFAMNQAPPQLREPALGDRLVPGVDSSTRIRMNVASDGTPSIEFADAANRPRIRFSVKGDGDGSIEFLNERGEVIQSILPTGFTGSGD